MPFVCSICEEASTQICARCTKDVCSNHLCEKCLRCSDCCECELALDGRLPESTNHTPFPHATVKTERETTPEPPLEEPDAGPSAS